MHSLPTFDKTYIRPRGNVDAAKSARHVLTDEEKATCHAEIARRYAWHNKHRREANPLRLLTIARVRELELIFVDIYGLYLPDDDSGWDDLTIMGHHLAHFGGTAERIVARIVEWAAIWAPAFPTDKVTDRAKLIAANPLKWKADTLAWRLGLTMAQRTRLKIKTIGAIDVKRRDRPAWLREYHRQRKKAERRAKGIKPRDLANSDSAKKWWVVLGMSRATWYRKGKPMPETEPAREPSRETGTADYKDRIRSAALVSPTTTECPDRPGKGLVRRASDPLGEAGATAKGATKKKAKRSPRAGTSPKADLVHEQGDVPVVDELGTPSSTLVLPERAYCRRPNPPVGSASIVLIVPHLVRHDGFGRVPIDQGWAQPMRALAAAVATRKAPFGVLPCWARAAA